MLPSKINRAQIVIAKKDELDDKDAEYWRCATIEEKLQTITYLRECFYGEAATFGRINRADISIISRNDLIKNKRASGRSMDMADVEKLTSVSPRGFTRN